MSFHVKRSNVASKGEISVRDGLRTSRWVRPAEGNSVLEIQTYTNPSEVAKIPKGHELDPPYHWHWYQEEYFTIRQGRFIFTLEGQDKTVSATDPQPVVIPVHARHTFRVDSTCTEPCQLEIETAVSPMAKDPEDAGTTARFFRNIYQYLDDCRIQKVSPSLPQLLLLLDSAEVSLAIPGLPGFLMRPLTYGAGVLFGRWLGGYVLGYKASYPEYYDPSIDSRKSK